MVVRDNCPVCGSIGTHIFSQTYGDSPVGRYTADYYSESGNFDAALLEGASFTVLECPCGMLWQREIPNDAFMNELYETWLNPGWGHSVDWGGDMAAEQSKTLSELQGLLLNLRKPSTQVRVLDVGMGWSRWLVPARALGCQTFGIELSPERRAFAQRHGVTLLDWADLDHQRFDLINCDQVLEHLPDPLDSLRQIVRGLAPEGIIRLGVPNAGGIKHVLSSYDWTMPKSGGDRTKRQAFLMSNPVMPIIPLQHINAFTPATFRMLLERSGLHVAGLSPAKRLKTWSMAAGGAKQLAKIAIEAIKGPIGTNLIARKA